MTQLKQYILGILLIASTWSLSAQSTKTNDKTPIDSSYVEYFHSNFDSIYLGKKYCIDTTLLHAADYDCLNKANTIFSTLSNIGMANKSLRFNHQRQIGFDMNVPSFSQYIITDDNSKAYIPTLPYSEIRYMMGFGNKEQHLGVKFGRQFLKRFYVSLNYDLDYAPATFKNNKANNNYFWINTRYTTEDERYGIIAHYYRNKIEVQENGGLLNDEDYISGNESDNTVITTNLSSAQNTLKVSGVSLSHYFNLLPKTKRDNQSNSINDTITYTNSIDSLQLTQENDTCLAINKHLTDTIVVVLTDSITQSKVDNKRRFTLGRINHYFRFQRNKMFYNESNSISNFYLPYDSVLDLAKTYDSTIYYSINNTLKWNTLGYQKYSDDIPFFLYAGIDYGIYKLKGRLNYITLDYEKDQNFAQFKIIGGIIINLFKSTRITGDASIITIGYQAGDFNLRGNWRQYLGTQNKNAGSLNFDISLRRQSPSWFETEYYSNHFRWNNNFSAATYFNMHAYYKILDFEIGASQTTIGNYIYFNEQARPAQSTDVCNIWEIYGNFHHTIRRFDFEGYFSFQSTSKTDIIRLPMISGRLKMAYSQPIFNNKAVLQPSISIAYFTSYYADAYMPATRVFYLQNDVMIGNYPYIDMFLSLKVKRANIYFGYSNMFMLSGIRNSFIAPHYPMHDSKMFIGVNWRLFG